MLPIDAATKQSIESHRCAIQQIIQRKDPRHLLIMGPCSVHSFEGALNYANALKKLQEQVADVLYIVMRVYVEKPRSTVGWKGMAYDPYINGSDDIQTGIRIARELFIEIAELGIPIATEFVDHAHSPYYEDLISWGCIGARTSSSQPHRQLVSGLDFPVGFKNSVEGIVQSAIEGMIAANASHSFLHPNDDGKLHIMRTSGNPFTHLILRGAHDHDNANFEAIMRAYQMQRNLGIATPILVDCSHGNSNKKIDRQKLVFESVGNMIVEKQVPLLGLMLESYLKRGNQPDHVDISKIDPELSITDPCLSFAESKELVIALAQKLSQLPCRV